jgi:hypothetical protein
MTATSGHEGHADWPRDSKHLTLRRGGMCPTHPAIRGRSDQSGGLPQESRSLDHRVTW